MATAAASVMEYLFQRSLDDLVKGLRGQSIGESRYVSKALEEIRKEIKSTDAHTKAVALQKLLYLNMLQGCDMSWAAFHVVEVMSLPKFAHKKIGYLAASQSFHEGTDVLLLITNLLKKDLASKNEFEAGLALECLSRIATPDLARDLTPEVFTMLASSKLYIRKKVTLVLLKVFSKHPDAIRVAFKRLVEKLEDPEPQVLTACVSVLHELARKDPHPYLPLAPELYRLLLESTNNWLCIKLVKMFALLLPLEPRLAKKIAEPLCQQMRRTNAKSLVFECIRTVTTGLMDHPGAVQLASEKLREILGAEDEDPNLKYLGLQALLAFMDTHPSIIEENKSVIVKCLNDGDPSVQMGSLRLIIGMVSESNVAETVEILIKYARTAEKCFCNELISAILSTCSRGFYELITHFTWYVNVLGELARIPQFEQGQEVERQLVDIGLRVESVRRDLVKLARDVLVDSSLWDNSHVHRVLAGAAWIAGEYVELARDPFGLVEALLQPRLKRLPASVQAVYLQAVLKVFVFYGSAEQVEGTGDTVVVDRREYEELDAQGDEEIDAPHEDEEKAIRNEQSVRKMLLLIKENAGPLMSHVDTEVQERASDLFGLINLIEEDGGTSSSGRDLQDSVFAAMREIFSVELGPVSQLAQQRVAVPDGLELLDDLDELKDIIGDTDILSEDFVDKRSLFSSKFVDKSSPFSSQQAGEAEMDESAGLLAKHRQKNETYYLPKEAEGAAASEELPPKSETPQSESQPLADNLKLTEQALVWSNKPRRPRARPVVVKLMDEEESHDAFASSAKSRGGLKDSVLSSAIRDVLSGAKQIAADDGARHGSSGRQQQHRSVRKHKKNKSVEEGDTADLSGRKPELGDEIVHEVEAGQQEQRRSKRHHRRRAKSPLKVAPQAPVVPDFLL